MNAFDSTPISLSIRKEVGLSSLSPSDIIAIGSKAHVKPVNQDRLKVLFPYLKQSMKDYGINTPLRMAHFFAQIMIECDYFGKMEESLNYSPEQLRLTFDYFKNHPLKAFMLGRHKKGQAPDEDGQRQIADLAYNGKNDNAVNSDDGWNFRGRGLMQLTGRANYQAFKDKTGVDFIAHPELMSTPQWAVESATWYWGGHGGNHYADKDEFAQVTFKINGGFNGFGERLKVLDSAKMVLGAPLDNLFGAGYSQDEANIQLAYKMKRKKNGSSALYNQLFQ